ncbi:MAG: gamma-glutamyltransferase [Rhodobacter sp.]|nr:gamma-glutamyltransferase [Rhodobacter sp.]MCY4168674.1 gamma-glutamyltransferase [Rhodobacter sp.]MCY4241744.1 gamma-glutamyltransferase [Rhodobacter sp.]
MIDGTRGMDCGTSVRPGSDQTGGMRNAGSPTPAIFPPPESMRPTLVGREFAVSAGHPIVAQVMAEIMAQGGTAVDAGVAGGFLSNVVQVDMCNLGGVAPTLIKTAGSDRFHVIDGVGPWSQSVTLEAFLKRHDGKMPLGSPVGVVPATFDVWCTALSQFGTWRLADIMGPAIDYAERGFPLDPRSAKAFELLGNGFAKYEASRAVYWPRGRPPRPGEWLIQADLARTLSRLAACDGGTRADGIANARELFYEGEIAERIIAFHQATGGWLTVKDLAAYRSPVETAPETSFRGWRVATPGMVCQGPVMLQALAILDGMPLERMAHGSPEYLHAIAEALKQGFAERERHYTDPVFATVAMEELLSGGRIADLRDRIDPECALPGAAGEATSGRGRADTTYIAAADAAGNVFSSMPSDTIDGAPIAPGLGFFVSPRGVQSRLAPGHPAAIAPGKRPRLTPAPAIAVNESTGEALAIGCPGGDMIVQSMTQSFLNMVVYGMTPQQAVESPRIATFSHPGSFYPHPAFPMRLAVEGRVPEATRAALAAKGHIIYDWPDFEFDAGGVSIAGRRVLTAGEPPVLVAAADPRRITYAAGR